MRTLALLALTVWVGMATAVASPQLKLVKSGTAAVSIDWVIMGTPTYGLDLRADSDGHPVGGLYYYITTTPADALTYRAVAPLTALNDPFVAGDLDGFGQAPVGGALVGGTHDGITNWYPDDDYAAFTDRAIGTYYFNTSSLQPGSYVFTTEGAELINNTPGEDITEFGPPGTFTLTVVPEPGASALLGVGGWALAGLRRYRSRPRLRALKTNAATVEPRFGALDGAGSMRAPLWKRVLDVGCVGVASPLLVPLMLLVALAVKLASGGPVLFRQERVGWRGRRFTCLKFRSMAAGADTSVHQAHLNHLIGSNLPMTKMDSHGDLRLIPCGRLLRVTALDELPQVINVLRGEMSLVGPRPCMPYEYDKYEPWQKERFNALPGLTGLWQVSGKNRTTFTEMMQLDIAYVRNKSLWLDLKIILKTIPALLAQVRDAQRVRRQPCGPVGPGMTVPIQ
ncbi:MAG: sugar transferase [Verrucomicrobia bacterium]|nr:sugar transferase [Verrucomicrobiota bacterium]